MNPETEEPEPEGEPSATEELADLLDVDGLEELNDLPDALKAQPLHELAATGIGEAVGELADGRTEAYMNTRSSGGVDRLAIVTDDTTVRILALTTGWKWRGPYTPEDPAGYLTERGYEPTPDPDVGEEETDE